MRVVVLRIMLRIMLRMIFRIILRMLVVRVSLERLRVVLASMPIRLVMMLIAVVR